MDIEKVPSLLVVAVPTAACDPVESGGKAMTFAPGSAAPDTSTTDPSTTAEGCARINAGEKRKSKKIIDRIGVSVKVKEKISISTQYEGVNQPYLTENFT
jgi:hypothetical protein